MNLLWRILNGLMGALFLFAAILQFNDDDPARWIVLYLAAAIPCLLTGLQRNAFPFAMVVGGGSLIWAAAAAVQGAWAVPFDEMFAEWEMKNEAVTHTREMFGLLIIAAWMAVIAVFGRPARRRTEP